MRKGRDAPNTRGQNTSRDGGSALVEVTASLDSRRWLHEASLRNRIAARDPSPSNLAALRDIERERPPC